MGALEKVYIQPTENLTLSDNFISYAHYITLELHQFALYKAFPHLDPADIGIQGTMGFIACSVVGLIVYQ